MATRDNPYGNFNFMVKLGDTGGEDQIAGGFSDVSGLGNEVKFAEYRNGNDKENHIRKIAERQLHRRRDAQARASSVTCGSSTWLQGDPARATSSPRTVTITLLDEARDAGLQLGAAAAQPKKWVGPTLAGKGGGEVAMEELHLVAESIEFKSS